MAAAQGAAQPAARNIEEVVRLERAAERARPPSSRVADLVAGMAGTLGFVLGHLGLIGAWAAVNTGRVPGMAPFDPWPFGLLGGLFSLEGVLLAAFVLMKQNRMSARAEERAHLDLQVSLLAEQEVTKVIQMLERISAQLGIAEQVVDAEARELGEVTAVGELARDLHVRLEADEGGGAPSRDASGAPLRDTSGAPSRDTSGAPSRDTSGAPSRDISHAPPRDD